MIIHFVFNYNVLLPITGTKFGFFEFAKEKERREERKSRLLLIMAIGF